MLQCRDPKQPRREFVDMGRKSTSKYDNGKRITKPPRLSAPGTRFDGTQVCICYFRCTCTLLVHLLQCSCLMWECYELVPSGLHHLKHSGPACCCSLPAVLTSSCFWSPVSSGSLSGLLVDTAPTLLLCSPLCNSPSGTSRLQRALTYVHRYAILVQLSMPCPGQAWRSSCCALWCMSLDPTLPLRLMSWGPAASCRAFSGGPANAGRSSSSLRYTPLSGLRMLLSAMAACLFQSCILILYLCWVVRNRKARKGLHRFGVNLTRSQVSHRAARGCLVTAVLLMGNRHSEDGSIYCRHAYSCNTVSVLFARCLFSVCWWLAVITHQDRQTNMV